MDKEPQNPEAKSAEWRKNLLSLVSRTQINVSNDHIAFTSSDKKLSIIHFDNGFVCSFATSSGSNYIFHISLEGFLTKILSISKEGSALKDVLTDDEDRAEKEHLINRTLARYEKEIKERYIPMPSKADQTQVAVEKKVLGTLEKMDTKTLISFVYNQLRGPLSSEGFEVHQPEGYEGKTYNMKFSKKALHLIETGTSGYNGNQVLLNFNKTAGNSELKKIEKALSGTGKFKIERRIDSNTEGFFDYYLITVTTQGAPPEDDEPMAWASDT